MAAILRPAAILGLWFSCCPRHCVPGRLLADEAPAIDPIGRPKNFTEGQALGYAVWYEAGYWELRATSPARPGAKPAPNKREGFTGTVTVVGGTIEEGRFEGLEGRRQQGAFDWVKLHPGRRGFDFHLVTRGKIDSLKFKVSRGAETIEFNLLTNGDNVPERIRIGSEAQHPATVPFTLPAHPVNPEPAPAP